MIDDYYRVLDASPSASAEEIKKAYRRLAMAFHPDRNPEDPQGEDRFKEINEAYAVLGDPLKRAEYDRLRLAARRRGWNEDALRDFDFSSLFQEFGLRFDEEIRGRFFCSGRRGGCGRGKRRFFREAFTETSLRHPGKAVHDLHLSPIEAMTGTEREVWLNGSRRYVIRIPAGVTTGTLIRLPIGEPDGLYLRVRLRSSE